MKGTRLVGLMLAVLGAAGLAQLSQMPVAPSRPDTAFLRLAWRARPERIEHCVAQSSEALAALPPHMRQSVICEGVNASYQLAVWHNDVLVADRHVKPGGLRADRPLYVFLEIAVTPGEAPVRITFTRVEPAPPVQNDDDARRAALREAVPASLVWDDRLTLAPGQVHLISYDPEQRTLFEVAPR